MGLEDVGWEDGFDGGGLGLSLLHVLRLRLDRIIKPSFFAFLWLLVYSCVWLGRNNAVFNQGVWNPTEVLTVIKKFGWERFSVIAKGRENCIRNIWFVNPCTYIGI